MKGKSKSEINDNSDSMQCASQLKRKKFFEELLDTNRTSMPAATEITAYHEDVF